MTVKELGTHLLSLPPEIQESQVCMTEWGHDGLRYIFPPSFSRPDTAPVTLMGTKWYSILHWDDCRACKVREYDVRRND